MGFHFADDKNAVQATDTVNAPKFVEHKILIVRHIADKNLDHKVEIARSVVTFRDFVDVAHRFHEFFAQTPAVLLEFDVAKHHNRVAHFLWIHFCHVALDISFAFQAALSLEGGRGRKMHLVGQLLHRKFGVALQRTQDFNVRGI